MSKKDTPLTINKGATLSKAIKQLNACPETLTLIVTTKHQKVVGTLTDGDIRRWLSPLSGKPTHGEDINLNKVYVREIMNCKPIVVNADDSWFEKITEARSLEKHKGVHIRLIPVIDHNGKLKDVLDLSVAKPRARLEVILMAKAKLKDINRSIDTGRYSPCITYKAVIARREQYDTIRYAYEREKYAALREVIEKESNAIKNHRRLDELYMSLKRGQEWAGAITPPSGVLQKKLKDLENDLKSAREDLILGYIQGIIGKEFIGNKSAANAPDIVFVLGCKNTEEQDKRIDACATFLKMLIENEEKLPQALVLSGGGIDSNRTEADKMESKFRISDIYAEAKNMKVLKEEDSLDTVGNAIFGQLTLIGESLYCPSLSSSYESGDAIKICIFTSEYHAHRTLDLFQRLFHNALVAVRFVRRDGELKDRAQLAMDQLDSEARANSETFALRNAVTGMSTSITKGHVQSLFFQLMTHHDMYKRRYDLIRKYADVLNKLSGDEEP
ncbi:MAG: CBS domain-containing protein [Syntrophales bacterium]